MDGIMSAMTSKITGVSIVCATVGSGADQGKYQSSSSPVFVCGEFTGERWIPTQKASNAENVSFDDVFRLYS